ncbi:DUF2946 domain-containing protein [Caballeronia ptereochthonis]|uniref:MFS transporter n=1 Tax=Caballeronia ptereochthonis TaxID=1777144 RepID=A0A158AEQ4_9BURK|nr:DUF2946 domain-containing protein [Caballeronia ptereochthonis]SAK56199.1 MFS transporter [Caballeronia ptereochthonis]
MHHLRRGIIGKIGGIAAICAMLLLSLAPVASQALERARMESLLASVCAADAHASRLEQEPGAHHAKHDALGHLQACAYCDLIAHAPAPPSLQQRFGVGLTKREAFDANHFADAPRRDLISAAQPRAPPALV